MIATVVSCLLHDCNFTTYDLLRSPMFDVVLRHRDEIKGTLAVALQT
jgi:hypothetical protein